MARSTFVVRTVVPNKCDYITFIIIHNENIYIQNNVDELAIIVREIQKLNNNIQGCVVVVVVVVAESSKSRILCQPMSLSSPPSDTTSVWLKIERNASSKDTRNLNEWRNIRWSVHSRGCVCGYCIGITQIHLERYSGRTAYLLTTDRGDNNDITIAVTFYVYYVYATPALPYRFILVQCENNFKWQMCITNGAGAGTVAAVVVAVVHWLLHAHYYVHHRIISILYCICLYSS